MNSWVSVYVKKLFLFAMIAVLGFLIINKAVFVHTHKLENGTVYTHAHPYNKAKDALPFKSHHHTEAQFLFFNHQNLIYFSSSYVFALMVIACIKQAFFYNDRVFYSSVYCLNSDRAPPVL